MTAFGDLFQKRFFVPPAKQKTPCNNLKNDLCFRTKDLYLIALFVFSLKSYSNEFALGLLENHPVDCRPFAYQE